MTEELEELGGGDARVGRAAVCCLLSPAHAAGHECSVVQTGVGALTTQDPRASSLSRASKSFPLPSCQGKQALDTLNAVLGKVKKTGTDSVEVLRHTQSTSRCHLQESVYWLVDGFNATLLAFGQSAAGKSTTLFGEQCSAEQPLLFSVLQQIFAQTAGHAQQTHRVGLSCWEVVQHQVADLLVEPCQSIVPGQVCYVAS